jgi:hypothetical protein
MRNLTATDYMVVEFLPNLDENLSYCVSPAQPRAFVQLLK